MAAARGKTTARPRSGKPAARKRTASRQPQPATLTTAHVQGFFAGVMAGVLMGAAGVVWLTKEEAPDRPVPVVQEDRLDPEASRPEFTFFEALPEENLNLGNGAQPQPRAGDNAESEYSQYILQAGSFRRAEDADRRRGELALLGMEGTVERSEGENGVWYRVTVGPFANRSALMRARSLAAQADIDTLLMRRSTP